MRRSCPTIGCDPPCGYVRLASQPDLGGVESSLLVAVVGHGAERVRVGPATHQNAPNT